MSLSVIIPSRNERYLAQTVADLLANAVGDLEVIPVLDGPPFPVLPDDSRVRPIYHDSPAGMRPSINEAAAAARGEYLLKCDAHCAFDQGFDGVLLSEMEDNWVVVPRRYSLDPVAWERDLRDPPRDAHYLLFPWAHPDKPVLRGRYWKERAAARAAFTLDDEMTSQGSCWVMPKRHWDQTIGPLDTEHYGTFVSEFQEVGNKTWLSGGAVKVQKRTWYSHWYKREGQGYALSWRRNRDGLAYCVRHWTRDEWPERTRDFGWLIEKFWPVPTWPENWRERLAQQA